ncbi:UNVERIFIED_CONTAM: Oxysterol-binding protein [Gekko kuhli]
MSPVRLHSSNPNLCADIEFQTPPSHVSDPLESSMDYIKLQEEFCLMAQKVEHQDRGNIAANTQLSKEEWIVW